MVLDSTCRKLAVFTVLIVEMHWQGGKKTYHAYKTLHADNIHTSTKQMLEGMCQ